MDLSSCLISHWNSWDLRALIVKLLPIYYYDYSFATKKYGIFVCFYFCHPAIIVLSHRPHPPTGKLSYSGTILLTNFLSKFLTLTESSDQHFRWETDLEFMQSGAVIFLLTSYRFAKTVICFLISQNLQVKNIKYIEFFAATVNQRHCNQWNGEIYIYTDFLWLPPSRNHGIWTFPPILLLD